MLATMRADQARHRVALAAPLGSPIFELAVPCEVFGIDRPEIADPWYELLICPTSPGGTVLAGGFVAPQPGTMRDLAAADTVVVPGCTSVHTDPPAELVDAVREAHARGARIVGLCSGTFVLAAAGLLDGRRATTHWMHAAELAARYPAVTVDASVLYLQDDGVFTSAGTLAAIDLCLELVRRDHGAHAANDLARRMVAPPHRSGGQAQYARRAVPPRLDDTLSATLDWSVENLHRDLTVDDLARHARTSRRTLTRRFADATGTAPSLWLLQQRLARAQQLLETTMLPVDRVAERAGLGSASTLRRHFATHLDTTPTAYRSTFATTQPAGSQATTTTSTPTAA